MRFRPILAFLSVAFAASAAPPPAPSRAEQARVLDAARSWALDYTKALPDFICTEIISRSSDATGKGKSFSAVDTLTVLLTYFNRQEHYRLVQRNHAPTSESYDSLTGATSQGEFGTMLRRVFEPSCAAAFLWRSWADVRRRNVQVYSYRVARANSTLSLTYASGSDKSEMVAGYHGLIYIDAGAGAVLRVTMEADDLKGFEVSLASTTLDYDYADVAGHPYLLPLRAETRMRTGESMTRNVVDFLGYRKFTVDTTLDYPKEAEPAGKLP